MESRPRPLLCLSWLLAGLLCAPAARAQGATYELRPGSTILDECLFCDRAPIERPLSGSFTLTPIPDTDVAQYKLSELQLADPAGDYKVTGDGSYRRGTDGGTDYREMALTVEVSGAAGVQLAGSVKVPFDCWPAIDIRVTESTDPARDPSHVYTIHLVAAPPTDYVLYQLEGGIQDGSYLIRECLPCAPPVIPIPLTGTFLLGKLEDTPAWTTLYRIEAIDFKGAVGEQEWSLRGSGCYSYGGQLAVLQAMDLELTIRETAGVVLQSGRGTVEGKFPEIVISLRGPDPGAPIFEYQLHLVARPAGTSAGYRRGDPNLDGQVDLSDAVAVLFWLFAGSPAPSCLEAANADGDSRNDLTDAVYLLEYLFRAGPAPPAPGPEACGPAPVEGLGCESYPACAPPAL